MPRCHGLWRRHPSGAARRVTADELQKFVRYVTAVRTHYAKSTDKPAIRRRAVLALAAFEGDAVEARLQAALEDPDWQVRQAAEDLRAVNP